MLYYIEYQVLLGDPAVREQLRGRGVLELGCGLGLAGVAAAAHTD